MLIKKKINNKNTLLGFVGLTHLGIVSAAVASNKGHNVVIYDDDESKINDANSLNFNIEEPGLYKLIKKNKEKIFFTNNKYVLKKCKIVYFAHDVPTNKEGKSDLKKIIKLIKSLNGLLKKDTIFVILCQVPPGFTRKINWLKNKLYYQVETLIFGKAVERAANPERIIIGMNNVNKKIDKKLLIYLKSFHCPILTMRYESAELTKIAINIYLVSSITTTNILSEVSNKIGSDWRDITKALKFDKRIGKHAYLKPGLGISGGNLQRDIETLLKIQNKNKINNEVIFSWKKNSINQKKWVIKVFNQIIKVAKINKIAILGMTYKENTNSIKNSPSIELIKSLKKYKINVYDPKASFIINNKNLIRYENMHKCYENADILILMTPWQEFKKINLKKLYQKLNQRYIIDPYNLLNEKNCIKYGFNYFALEFDINKINT